MASEFGFTEEDVVIEEGLGYPRAYAKICRDYDLCPYNNGPPFTFTPYILQQNESLRSKELSEMFPVIDPKARRTAKPKIYLSLLWKQLNHLGNAGFDPAVIRVDPCGNVLYFHADSASPLAWDFDHWFPCSRGGLTVPSNLRILQWQACKNKRDKLEFLVPWWDLQVGISVNQFLSIFAASNSDFRRRAFSFLFKEGESEELNGSQTVESHHFPQHFVESKEKLGLAAAAVVVSRRESYDPSMVLRSLDYNRQTTGNQMKLSARKQKENPDFLKNPYHAIVAARDSLKQREEAHNMRAEIKKVDDELNEMTVKNNEERMTIQELERELIKRRRRAEKCRRLAESQCSYRIMLEKMIRDAMHQSVVYKEQVRLNQAATGALMARLEAQKAICDASEKELHKKFKEREELEKRVRPELEQARKRSRILQYEDLLLDDRDRKMALYLPATMAETPHRELRAFLEEENKASEAEAGSSSMAKEIEEEQTGSEEQKTKTEVSERSLVVLEDNPKKVGGIQEEMRRSFREFCVEKEAEKEEEEDEESRKERGRGNVEKWLQILLENNKQDDSDDPPPPQESNEKENGKRMDEIIEKLDLKFPLERKPETPAKKKEARTESAGRGRTSFDSKKTPEKKAKEKAVKRSESARAFRRIPSSPSLIFGTKKGVDSIRKKPVVVAGDDDENEYLVKNNFIRSSINTIKRAVKF
ncbi:PREDICTED: trichohyalin [Tarenaya hassleriana]|uniref:trichohyalin n=1 Tax=Tarenaya hassleriana TaxID=28532 RepID=UPI00053C7257|nr:PREDICTED: trichohyalin [Tarenaya hassleriana]